MSVFQKEKRKYRHKYQPGKITNGVDGTEAENCGQKCPGGLQEKIYALVDLFLHTVIDAHAVKPAVEVVDRGLDRSRVCRNILDKRAPLARDSRCKVINSSADH